MRKLVLLFTIGALTACTDYSEIAYPPQDVVFSSAFVSRSATGYQISEIRAVQGSGSSSSEIIGAQCSVQGDGFGAEVVTPTRLRLPVFEGNAEPLTVTCRAGGRTASRIVGATNLSTNSHDARMRNSGLVAIGLGNNGVSTKVGIIIGSDPSRDRYGYRRLVQVRF